MVEIRIENADLSDAVNRQVILAGRSPNCFRRRCIVYAEGLQSVAADVGMNPCHVVFSIILDDDSALLCVFAVGANSQAF